MFFWQNDNKAITQSFSRDLVNWLNILALTNNNNLNNNNNNNNNKSQSVLFCQDCASDLSSFRKNTYSRIGGGGGADLGS